MTAHRYELIDGVLLVTPSPVRLHQRAVVRLVSLLHERCLDDLEVLTAPFDVALADDTVMQPDILVARKADLTRRDLPTAPVLAVEILSPSTRLFDLNTKKARFEVAGCASYWVVDPDEPSLIAWNLIDGRFAEAAHVVGSETFTATTPYAVEVISEALVG
ncbi:MAG: Uma2 family endonuclease [Nocardioides sp.]